MSNVNYGVGIQIATSGSDYQTTLANAVVIDGCAFESITGAAILVDGASVSRNNIAGLQVVNNRAESVNVFLQFDYLATDSGWPTFMSGNYVLNGYYVEQNNVAGLKVSVNSLDPPANTVIRNLTGISTTATGANNVRGSVSITGSATTASVAFGTAESDANYFITLGTRIAGGTPANGSTRASYSAPGTAGFTINLESAPGSGNTVAVNWALIR